jgi:2-polyprenyl-3-methyl-5-hydroxy-6-metoxy-1,4-benzoquinol methylase
MATFDERAGDWDTPERIARAERIAETIRQSVAFPEGARAIELGAGTGLLGLALADAFSELVLADASAGMLEVAQGKIAARALRHVRTAQLELGVDPPPPGAPFDVALSLLMLHHVEDTPGALTAVAALLRPDGIVVAADLDKEDGSFHGPGAEGIHHTGFDRAALGAMAAAAGFRDVTFTDGGVIEREDGVFPLFLLIARREG